jgi:DNA-binding HxlR family transcriptional regulator
MLARQDAVRAPVVTIEVDDIDTALKTIEGLGGQTARGGDMGIAAYFTDTEGNELLARGACRYTDLRAGLPGIATNLLADRLRELEAAGIVKREDAPPPIATTLFTLTERGRGLQAVISELGRWGVPLMLDSMPDDEFRGQWLKLQVRMFLADREPHRPSSSVEVRAGDQTVVIDAAAGNLSMRLGADPVVSGSPSQVLALMRGAVALRDAAKHGLQVEGSRAALERILPERPKTVAS